MSQENYKPNFYQPLDATLLIMRDDLTDWLNRLMTPQPPLKSSEFLQRLSDGVLLCQLAQCIHDEAQPFLRGGSRSSTVSASGQAIQPQIRVASLRNVGVPSHARRPQVEKLIKWDTQKRVNIESFLKWCQQCNIHSNVLFETNGLIHQSEGRNVILTLYNVARMCTLYNMDVPQLVAMEIEVDQQEKEWRSQNHQISTKSVDNLAAFSCCSDSDKSDASDFQRVKNTRSTVSGSSQEPTSLLEIMEMSMEQGRLSDTESPHHHHPREQHQQSVVSEENHFPGNRHNADSGGKSVQDISGVLIGGSIPFRNCFSDKIQFCHSDSFPATTMDPAPPPLSHTLSDHLEGATMSPGGSRLKRMSHALKDSSAPTSPRTEDKRPCTTSRIPRLCDHPPTQMPTQQPRTSKIPVRRLLRDSQEGFRVKSAHLMQRNRAQSVPSIPRPGSANSNSDPSQQSNVPQCAPPPPPVVLVPLHQQPVDALTQVDKSVLATVRRCHCGQEISVTKQSEGIYQIGSRIVFLRLLRHCVMVRVGGGWLELASYLRSHKLCQARSALNEAGEMYFVCRGQYVAKAQQHKAAAAPSPYPSAGGLKSSLV